MTDIVGKYDVITRAEAVTRLTELADFTPEEAETAIDFIVDQFTDNANNVNWSFALDVTLWVYELRWIVKLDSASFGDLTIYDNGDFYVSSSEES